MGAARAIVALMDAHKQALLQEKASWALMNLGAQVHDNKSRIHDEGGVEALLAALKRLPGHTGVQRQARPPPRARARVECLLRCGTVRRRPADLIASSFLHPLLMRRHRGRLPTWLRATMTTRRVALRFASRKTPRCLAECLCTAAHSEVYLLCPRASHISRGE